MTPDDRIMVQICGHTYKHTGLETCPDCGNLTHDIDWATKNKMQAEWRLANPDAKNDGWWSI